MKSMCLFTLVVGCLLISASGVQAASILVHYSFDSNFNDDSGNNNHLSASSGTPNITTAAGEVKFGAGALNMDQSGTEEHLAFSSTVSLTYGNAWSMSWWGQRSSSALDSQGMVAGTIAANSNFIWTPDNSSVIQGLRLRNANNNNAEYGNISDDNAFHHWAVSYNGAGQVTAWRDGVNLGSRAWGGGITLTHVGAGTTTQNNSFWGQIDELYIFSGTLTQGEVNALRANNSLIIPAPAALPAGLLMLGAITMRRRR